MQAPHFLPLAQIDDRHFITVCRSGVVHLVWDRITTRLTTDEFRRVCRLLAHALDVSPPASFRDGNLQVMHRHDDECEFRLGAVVLLLSPDGFQELGDMVQEGLKRLDEILASGAWDEPEASQAPASPFEFPGRTPFSQN